MILYFIALILNLSRDFLKNKILLYRFNNSALSFPFVTKFTISVFSYRIIKKKKTKQLTKKIYYKNIIKSKFY